MSIKLSNGERESIDLVLDRATTADQNPANISTAGGAVNLTSTTAVQQLLSLLSKMPATEPPSDLVSRTLDLIDRSPAVSSLSAAASNSVISSLAARPLQ